MELNNEQTRTPEQIMQKQIRNKLYYIQNKERHLEKMNNYYQDIVKHDRFHCEACNKDILRCAWLSHLQCKKHIKNINKPKPVPEIIAPETEGK